MFGFDDDDDDFGAFDNLDFGEARDPTDFITPDTQPTNVPQPTSPSPSLQFPLSPINNTQSLSPAPAPLQQPSAGYRKSKWTPEEDDMLRNSVKIHGTKNWTAVSTLVPGRNPKQCRERWTAQLDPALTRDDWTPQEDATLLHIHKLHGNAWAKIASFLPGRSSNAVKNRFNWLSRRHFPQAMNAIFVQPQPIQYNIPQMQFQMQIPRYNSLSPAQCGNFGFSDPSLELPPPRQAQSAAGSLTDNAIWDDYAPFQTSQSPIDELCGDFDWNMN